MNVNEIVTKKILEQLNDGVVPWRKPWISMGNGAYNYKTKRQYSLLNQIILGKPGGYLSFKEVTAMKGKVKKGEKANVVVFWKMYPVEETNAKGETVKKTIPVLRYYNVFHVDQCDGIEPPVEDKFPQAAFAKNKTAEEIVDDYLTRSGVSLEYVTGDAACYQPTFDRIVLPKAEQFCDTAEFYSTEFHELTHSTGHESRLNRLKRTKFGSSDYSREELVAEIGAAMLLMEAGIDTSATMSNSAAYIKNWIDHIKGDSSMVVVAAGAAEKAVKLILDIGDKEAA